MSNSISAIKSRYYAIAKQLDAPARHVHFATTPHHDGSPHVESRDGLYFYIVTERGSELDRRMTLDPNELLYWQVSDLTRAMASEYELAHRVQRQDSRRQLFAKHVELLATVDAGWAQKKQAEYQEILAKYPFRDS